MTHTHFKYCQYDEFVIPLLLNDIPLLIGRIVIFRQHLRRQQNQQNPSHSQSSTQPLTHQLSYFFLMKNLLVVILSVGNMYLHCQDCRNRRTCEKESESTPAQLDNGKPTPPTKTRASYFWLSSTETFSASVQLLKLDNGFGFRGQFMAYKRRWESE